MSLPISNNNTLNKAIETANNLKEAQSNKKNTGLYSYFFDKSVVVLDTTTKKLTLMSGWNAGWSLWWHSSDRKVINASAIFINSSTLKEDMKEIFTKNSQGAKNTIESFIISLKSIGYQDVETGPTKITELTEALGEISGASPLNEEELDEEHPREAICSTLKLPPCTNASAPPLNFPPIEVVQAYAFLPPISSSSSFDDMTTRDNSPNSSSKEPFPKSLNECQTVDEAGWRIYNNAVSEEV